jgi:hypothetical protein
MQASQMIAVEVNGEKVCVTNVDGRYYAIGQHTYVWSSCGRKP